jgi:predicted Zn-dependent protease
MAALAQSRDELAALLGHELAHNILGHRQRLDALHVDRGLFAPFGRNARLIRETEAEADRLSIHLMARAGYAPEAALAFWERVRSATQGMAGSPTHPRWPERLRMMQAECERIEAAGPHGKSALPADLAAKLPERRRDAN